MATLEYKFFKGVGKGVTIKTQMISLAGLVSVLKTVRSRERNVFRYSEDGGKTFTPWEMLYDANLKKFGGLTESKDLIFDLVYDVNASRVFPISEGVIDPYSNPASTVVYDKTLFKRFFESNDPRVLGWAVNVLEKLFAPGIVPLYVSRENEDDYNVFFLTITHFFAYFIIFARQYRQIQDNDLMMKNFIEGWGLIYDNVGTLEQRQKLFNNWKNEFEKRGTFQIVETGDIPGEIRRLVNYEKPNEFIFAALAPQDVGWCLGYSSPTWYGTETVNAVSKGWDFGPDYSVGDDYADVITFDNDVVNMNNNGDAAKNYLRAYTSAKWMLNVGAGEGSQGSNDGVYIGVGEVSDYPIIGEVERLYVDNMFVFNFQGSGKVGISTENDTSKVMEVYVGLDYEISVCVKADEEVNQNIEFGVNCYDANMNFVQQVRITDWRDTSSFFSEESGNSHNPCKVANTYYRLRGIIYNVTEERDETLYLNFEDGRPLRFMENVAYMAPYFLQDRTSTACNLYVAGITVKPLDLPFSQGYLGRKNVIAMYSPLWLASMTQKEIESFIQRYLVGYKNIVSYTWLNWVERTAYFLTFYIKDTLTGLPVEGATITLSNGFSSDTDEVGYRRFELAMNQTYSYTVEKNGVKLVGSVTMNSDIRLDLGMTLPLNVYIDIIQPTWGTVNIEGDKLPRTDIVLTATPNVGYTFIKWVFVDDETESIQNPFTYSLGVTDVHIQAIFEINAEIAFTPNEVVISAIGGVAHVTVNSSKPWILDEPSVDWISLISPTQGDAGETDIRIEIDEQGRKL